MGRTKKFKLSIDSKNIESRLEQFSEMIATDCPILRSTAIYYFRKLFATSREETKIPDDSIFYKKIVAGVVECLRDGNMYPDTMFDALWIITNMCCISEKVTHTIVKSNCVSILTKYVDSEDPKTANQCIWALANISADCSECKMKCRSATLMRKLAAKISNSTKSSEGIDIQNAIWCINNISTGGRVEWPKSVMTSLISGLFSHLVDQNGNPTTCAEKVLWSLANLADDMHNTRKIDLIINHPGLLETAMKIFVVQDETHLKLHTAALRLIGNVAVGNDSQTDRLIRSPMFREILNVGMKSEKHCSEIAWICSNVSAGTTGHLDFLLNDKKFYNWVLTGIHSGERRFRKECLWIVANMLATGDEKQIEWLVAQGVVHHLPRLLENEDIRLNEKALNAAVSILREHPYQRRLFEELKVVEHINPELLSDDAPFIFKQQKRTIEMMIAENAPPKRSKIEENDRFVLYTDIHLRN